MTRPVGQRPESERSDWTEQDILTIPEAAGRLEQEIADVVAALAESSDSDEKSALKRRLRAIEASRERLAE